MPFSDPIRQREHQREGARRRRAARREAAEVAPAPAIGDARADPGAAVPMPTVAQLDLAGRILAHARSPQESAYAYQQRLRDVWETFLFVVEG